MELEIGLHDILFCLTFISLITVGIFKALDCFFVVDNEDANPGRPLGLGLWTQALVIQDNFMDLESAFGQHKLRASC